MEEVLKSNNDIFPLSQIEAGVERQSKQGVFSKVQRGALLT